MSYSSVDDLSEAKNPVQSAVDSHVKPVTENLSEGRKLLRSWLGRCFRVVITDGRILNGVFNCTDKDANMVLAGCVEYLVEGGEPRILGNVMIPGKHIVSIEVEERAESDGDERQPKFESAPPETEVNPTKTELGSPVADGSPPKADSDQSKVDLNPSKEDSNSPTAELNQLKMDPNPTTEHTDPAKVNPKQSKSDSNPPKTETDLPKKEDSHETEINLSKTELGPPETLPDSLITQTEPAKEEPDPPKTEETTS